MSHPQDSAPASLKKKSHIAMRKKKEKNQIHDSLIQNKKIEYARMWCIYTCRNLKKEQNQDI